MRFYAFFLAVVTFLCSSGCATSSRTFSVTTTDISHTGVIQKPVVVDLNVEATKIRGTATGVSTNVQAVKNEAINNALSTKNADVLVEPNFTITSRNANVTVEVTGYPGTYKDFRMISDSDSTWLQHSNAIYMAKRFDTVEKQSVVSEQQKKKRVWYYIGSGAGLLLLILASGL